ncbi:RNA-binding protein [Flaviaesturariibacter amylovorans]|uniref:RRM domain-containing protein n=1 Tax=Flaviaesturariibacter amylovorans TaxID=1084520 RepID=A0ABP8H851_9BACT
MNIAIYNLDSEVTNAALQELFTPFGPVASAEIALDAFTGVSRGFGQIVMDDETAALNAIRSLHDTEFKGLQLSVQEAPEKKEQLGSYKVGTGPVRVYKFRKN